MKRCALVAILMLTCVSCMTRGPGRTLDPRADSEYLNPDGTFILYVSNQSFTHRYLDIRVEIDGQLVVHNIFRVGNQHNWVPFTLSLPDGPHVITATSGRAGVRLEEEFTVNGKQAVILDYVYSPDAETAAKEKHFRFKLARHDVGFV